MNQKILSRIQGSEKLIDMIGHWPDFHDAEIVEMLLQRTKDEAEIGPTLIAKFHIEHDKNYLVTLKFFSFERLVLDEFNYQNVINGLDLEEIKPGRSPDVVIKVTITSGFGVGGSFNCSYIKVVAIEDYV